MISIALVLFLILGVNQVFEYTTKAVGAGEAINAAIRGSRAIQATFATDFSGLVPPGSGVDGSGGMIISSRMRYAYRNAADMASQGQLNGAIPAAQFQRPTPIEGGQYVSQDAYPLGAPYQDFSGNGVFGDSTVPGDITYPYQYNNRNHRLDVMSFFARDLFHRQTGNPGVFVDDMSSAEAWIWYGHLWLPDNSGAFQSSAAAYVSPPTFPCSGLTKATNPNNLFGNQLVLGRVAMLLTQAQTDSLLGKAIRDHGGNAQWYVDDPNPVSPPSGTPFDPRWLTPLSQGSPITQPAGTGADQSVPASGYSLQTSRVDLANTSIASFRSKLQFWESRNNRPDASGNIGAYYLENKWWEALLDGEGNSQARFQCTPFVNKPMRSSDMAYASPYLMGACSQFIVEYAGDYFKQDNDPSHVFSAGGPTPSNPNNTNYGDITTYGSDGQIDYKLVTDNTTTPPTTRKQIIWYGMPRYTSGAPTFSIDNGDVAPLCWWIQQKLNAPGGYAPFEKSIPAFDNTTQLASLQENSEYICAWAPGQRWPDGEAVNPPSLIRITLTLDDPTGRLPNGQTYQYVFPVP
jgi:hypothetical protein